mmetsp:Transcript_15890/g.34467  ORF Transcript_15890/g.34467 Transcript_15890/m.34467 type:complete len:222 (-) Transcript_15890:209-874(-)|eukprot:CAMPEP_0118938720 /NCGR_PEP_ID=MMETSP1169-20130426/26869_1 /TAXON_ID=36882 /ORGANISM="Pyramimonas obovata, Strain CCMP722" /LENGTH=221 /DNA_ID=CAMNT_0006882755 /DNA_START=168 /DNA_END=833 /DNA_ORIENTATION=-
METEGAHEPLIHSTTRSGSLLSKATVTDLSTGGMQQPAGGQTGGSLLGRANVTDRSMPPPPPRAIGEVSSSAKQPPIGPSAEEEPTGPEFSFPGPAQIASSTAKLNPPPRQKVPASSQMAWVFLGKKSPDLAGLNGKKPGPVTMDEVKKHNTKNDAWMVLRGKVYNISPYMAYHPGGEKTLMAAAGKDGTKLFDKFHRWVNADFLMEKCLVGHLVEPNAAG